MGGWGGVPTFGKNSQIIPYFFSDAFPYCLCYHDTTIPYYQNIITIVGIKLIFCSHECRCNVVIYTYIMLAFVTISLSPRPCCSKSSFQHFCKYLRFQEKHCSTSKSISFSKYVSFVAFFLYNLHTCLTPIPPIC